MPRTKILDLLNEYEETNSPQTASNEPHVPNLFPRLSPGGTRIAIIGEAPGVDEVREGKPFVGLSGRFLTQLMSKAGIVRDQCFIGNISQVRPPGNDIEKASPHDIENGLQQLSSDLATFNPNICVLLGKTALRSSNGQVAIGDWRGSIHIGDRGPFLGRKCLPTYHPAACLRQYKWTPILLFDLMKAAKNADSPDFVPPSRNLETSLSANEIVSRLNKIYDEKLPVSVDIEGYVHAMSCISFATSPSESFIVAFAKGRHSVFESVEDEVRVWQAMARVLEDPTIPKVLQNCLYDTFVLQYSYGLVVRGITDDTMVKAWERLCELDKDLGTLCSFYTNEPYYKGDIHSEDWDTFWKYCCRDSAVTFEIANRLTGYLDPGQQAHYRFNMDLLNVFRYMEIRGLKYDVPLATQRLKKVKAYVYRRQQELDKLSGFGLKEGVTRQELWDILHSVMCWKKDISKVRAEYIDDYPRLKARLLDASTPLDEQFLGEFSMLCDLSLNIKSNKFKTYLHETLKLPPIYHRTTGAVTTNYEALLRHQKRANLESLSVAIDLGITRTRSQMLEIHTDSDGRIRCGYNEVGAATGRISCHTSPTGSGYNLQTLPDADSLKSLAHPIRKGMRDLVIADDGCYLFKCDLKGADGWTVGAHCASLGDTTMLEDLRAGIKPAQYLAFTQRHGHGPTVGKTRSDLKEMFKEVKKDDWDYFAYKQVIWGFCYLMGPRKASDHVFVLSEGRVNLSEGDMREAKRLLFLRYKVPLWWEKTQWVLARKPELVVASGHRRRFFGRREEILGEALAHEPQANTTYATNKAAWRLWNDPENRLVGGHLRVEPIHQVHDELLQQAKIEDTEWGIGKIKQWFANPMQIAGLTITIPFEGQYGVNWSMDETAKRGEF